MTTRKKLLLIASLSALFIACQKSGVSPVLQPKTVTQADTTVKSITSATQSGSTSSTQVSSINPALVGTWQLVSDSSSSYSQSNGSHGRKYLGTSTDKFTFTLGGMAYINEQASLDTGSYTVNPDHSIEIVYPSRVIAGVKLGNSADYFKISSLDSHNAVLADEGWTPAGFYFVRIVTLAK